MRKVWITEAETITPFGDDVEGLWQAISEGKTAIRPVKRFPVDGYNARIASYIEDLVATDARSMIYTLLERLCRRLLPVATDTLLMTATTKAGIDNLEKMHRGCSADVRDILPGSLLEEIRRKLNLTGDCININSACTSSTIAVANGATLIASGFADSVLVLSMDLVTEFVYSGFSSLQALSTTPCRPFDRDRTGLSLGEGAAALLLMSSDRAKREGRAHLGTILGWGAANDASHITAPAKNGCGLKQAILKALQTAECETGEIAAINAHGTGTVYNDLMELTAFFQVFGNRRIPIFSIKGAIGHSLGAAGGIEIAIGLKVLREQVVPPTIGFLNPEKGAEGRVAADPVDMSGDLLLTTNSGFGGINAAIVLKKGSVK